MTKEALILKLYEIEGVKFGSFTLKSGITSPIYIDIRGIISYPEILKAVGELMWQKLENKIFDFLCGVPYTALPIATAVSLEHDIPMVLRRKESKNYGTKKLIEGIYKNGDVCVIIEDIATSGGSVLDTVRVLKDVGLKIGPVIVLIDREQGGLQNLKNNNLDAHAVFTLSEILEILQAHQKINSTQVHDIHSFIQQHQIKA